ncbi:MAG TPA: hypothetical protein VE988_16155 [Gemmataceae bacterium]|nr:hypothetical protein [Gemmataceae bacterium]
MAEAVTTITKLLVVREIQEDESGATLIFQNSCHGQLGLHDPNYALHLRLARRSQERQHPIGVSFGERHAIAELNRADNDVPTEISDENSHFVQVLFQGHDGVFRLKSDHPEATRLRSLLEAALRQKGQLWFIAQHPDLTLVDVQPC